MVKKLIIALVTAFLLVGFYQLEETSVHASETIVWPDSDGDGCADAEEANPNDPRLGGLRDPDNPWDFFDPDRNGSVGFTDFLRLIQRTGTHDSNGLAVINRNSDPFTTPDPGPGKYHPWYDRGPQVSGGYGWDNEPPNGSIGFGDILALIRQVGHTCQGPQKASLAELAVLCDGNFKEATDPQLTELHSGESVKECLIFRDEADVPIDILFIEESLGVPSAEVVAETQPLPGAEAGGQAIALGTTITPHQNLWQFGSCTVRNRATHPIFRYTLFDFGLRLHFGAVVDPNNFFYSFLLERDVEWWNSANYPWTLTSGANLVPDGPPRWGFEHFTHQFDRKRTGDAFFRPIGQNWAQRTLVAEVEVFWTWDQSIYNGNFPSEPGVLCRIWTRMY